MDGLVILIVGYPRLRLLDRSVRTSRCKAHDDRVAEPAEGRLNVTWLDRTQDEPTSFNCGSHRLFVLPRKQRDSGLSPTFYEVPFPTPYRRTPAGGSWPAL